MDSELFVAKYAEKIQLKGIKKAILCFSASTAKKLQKAFDGKRIHCLGACWDIYTKNETLVISQFGLGAPSALLQFEYLKAFQTPSIFSLGSLASFHQKHSLGQELFIQKAYYEKKSYFSNKSTQKFFLENQMIENPSKELAKKLIKNYSLSPITSVSCDTPYKISKKDFYFYKRHKISGLEMEAAPLMFASKEEKIPLFCLAIVSDFISDNHWEMGFSHKKVQKALFHLLEKLLYSS